MQSVGVLTGISSNPAVIAVIRGLSPTRLWTPAEALFEGGVTVLEVTVDTPGAFGEHRGPGRLDEGEGADGAGTVLTASAQRRDPGGRRVLVSPNLNEDVIKTANRHRPDGDPRGHDTDRDGCSRRGGRSSP